MNHTVVRLSQAVAIGWITWLLTWLAFWRWSATKTEVSSSAEQTRYQMPQTVGTLLIGFGGGQFGRIFTVTPGIATAALIIVYAGLLWTVWARLHLGRNWSVDVSLKAGHRIVSSGPYAVTRHPIYTGLLAAFAGTAMIRGTALAAAGLGLIVVALHLKLKQEEALLTRHFGEEYGQYRRDVRGLIPFIW